jgi:hypothetical protein
MSCHVPDTCWSAGTCEGQLYRGGGGALNGGGEEGWDTHGRTYLRHLSSTYLLTLRY